jgi:hypothetical protein
MESAIVAKCARAVVIVIAKQVAVHARMVQKNAAKKARAYVM